MGISKLVAAAALVALPSMGSAVTIGGGLGPFAAPGAQNSGGIFEPIPLSALPGQFNADFFNGDTAGMFEFKFINDSATVVQFSIADITILQTGLEYFSGGVTAQLGSDSRVVAQGTSANFELVETLDVGEEVTLSFSFGDPVGPLPSALSPSGTGPDIDFLMSASPAPIPLPAGLPLLAGALLGMGWFARRKQS